MVNETESSQSPGSSELTNKAKLAPAYFENPEDSQSSPQSSLMIRKKAQAARKLVESLSESPSEGYSSKLSAVP